MASQDSKASEGTGNNVDDRQLILPYINTNRKIFPSIQGKEEKTAREAAVYMPAGVAFIGAGMAFFSGLFKIAAISGVVAFGLFAVGLYVHVKMSRAWYLTPDGMLKEYISYRFLRRSLPWGFQETAQNTHNIRCIHDDEAEEEEW